MTVEMAPSKLLPGCFLVRAFVAFLTVSLSDNCRAILIWYCELLLLKCVSSASARSDYVAIGPDGKKLTSSTGANPWRHKDGKVKTHYSFNKITGKVRLLMLD
jgi:hypothetical protein